MHNGRRRRKTQVEWHRCKHRWSHTGVSRTHGWDAQLSLMAQVRRSLACQSRGKGWEWRDSPNQERPPPCLPSSLWRVPAVGTDQTKRRITVRFRVPLQRPAPIFRDKPGQPFRKGGGSTGCSGQRDASPLLRTSREHGRARISLRITATAPVWK